MELMKAHNQWKNRPADERYFDLQEMLPVARAMKQRALERTGVISDLRVEAAADDMALVGRQGVGARLSNHAFGQLCNRVGAPASYLRELPATLAAQNLNHGLKALSDGEDRPTDASLLLDVSPESLTLRAITTTRYQRIWNADIIERLISELPATWKSPRGAPRNIPGERTRIATAEDVMDGSLVQLGQTVAPSGCFLGDRDMFTLIIDTDHVVEDGTDHPLRKGVMLWNSEVGSAPIGGMFFRFKHVCQNLIVWGAESVLEFEHRHVGRVQDRVNASLAGFQLRLTEYANDSVSDEEAKIKTARTFTLGQDKDAVIDAVLTFARTKKLQPLTKKLVEAGYDKAVEHESWYGNPHSLYGMVNGITEASQVDVTNFGDRVAVDTAAGKLLDMPF